MAGVRLTFQELINRMALMQFDDEVRCEENERVVVVGDAPEGRFELYEGQEPCGCTDNLWTAAMFISDNEYLFFM